MFWMIVEHHGKMPQELLAVYRVYVARQQIVKLGGVLYFTASAAKL
jgi:hypothetical protein